jgi:hypothetical protein
LKGRQLKTLLNAGTQAIDWDLRDSKGVKVEDGIYLAKETETGQTLKISVKK